MGNLRQSMTQDEWDELGVVAYKPKQDNVSNPAHYGGKDNPYEAIKVIEAWNLGFNLGNVVKYVARAGKKNSSLELEDLEKAKWYLDRQIEKVKTK